MGMGEKKIRWRTDDAQWMHFWNLQDSLKFCHCDVSSAVGETRGSEEEDCEAAISHLKEFGSGRVGGVGVSTKEKVRNIQVKAFWESGDLTDPCKGIRTKSMEENQCRFFVVGTSKPQAAAAADCYSLWHPAVHSGAIVKLHCAAKQPTGVEVDFHALVDHASRAEAQQATHYPIASKSSCNADLTNKYWALREKKKTKKKKTKRSSIQERKTKELQKHTNPSSLKPRVVHGYNNPLSPSKTNCKNTKKNHKTEWFALEKKQVRWRCSAAAGCCCGSIHCSRW